jgi:hypothetical protein
MKKMRHQSPRRRLTLLAGVSVVALAAAAPNAVAADLSKPAITKAPPPAAVVKERWSWWLEGGAFNMSGDPATAGASFLGGRPKWGPEGAAGFDWQPQGWGPWHLSGQFRYGSAEKSRPLSAHFATAGGTTVTLSGNQKIREDHWLVDFAVGRDFGLGNANAQWKLGLRVADLRSKLNANINVTATTFTPVGLVSVASVHKTVVGFQQRSTFVGAGPRFGVEGSTPLGGSWSFDWLAGAAVLFGERNLTQNITVAVPTQNSSDSAAVFNVDAQAGLAYWINPNLKITASYRVDAYFHALKTLNPAATVTSAPSIANVDRIYNGPMVRLTSTF